MHGHVKEAKARHLVVCTFSTPMGLAKSCRRTGNSIDLPSVAHIHWLDTTHFLVVLFKL